MAINRITIEFIPCDQEPANGYSVKYRPIGSTEDYRDGGNYGSSPIVIEDISDGVETFFEGFVQTDCGDGNFGTPIPFSTL